MDDTAQCQLNTESLTRIRFITVAKISWKSNFWAYLCYPLPGYFNKHNLHLKLQHADANQVRREENTKGKKREIKIKIKKKKSPAKINTTKSLHVLKSNGNINVKILVTFRLYVRTSVFFFLTGRTQIT